MDAFMESPFYRQALAWTIFIIVLGVLFFAHRILFRLLRKRVDAMPGLLDAAMVDKLSAPSLMIFLWVAAATFGHVQLAGHSFAVIFAKINTLLLIGISAWFAFQLIRAVAYYFKKTININVSDNLRARRSITQLMVFQALADSLVVIVALVLCLLTFDTAKAIGISILTSAGIIGIVVGFAAQKSIGLVLAGLQIALTQPIRIDDVVVVEGEWGRIEEIKLTYVVVKIWDERRLILPVTYFLETPFQNWTRTNADILGTVSLFLNHDAPINKMREELQRLVKDNPNWDKRAANIQITDAGERHILARILVSSADSSKNWSLRVAVREQMIAYLNRYAPGAFVRAHIAIDNSSPRRS
ncbi:MAG: mechanosensitive ion channel [Kiritimatiellae bacterium]|nr:mechanosensitive ion channel [Kiritimatiellia bacterium]MDD3545269.1 mechanosensitive ion channel [Kiritimatiellia bacterium]MDD4025533.1 mechanosensitive ion channel [Kiritimatiellia bacterium]MDD4621607.1 mechanosensitive ion channel [Kiritimatiellia bacterium]